LRKSDEKITDSVLQNYCLVKLLSDPARWSTLFYFKGPQI